MCEGESERERASEREKSKSREERGSERDTRKQELATHKRLRQRGNLSLK